MQDHAVGLVAQIYVALYEIGKIAAAQGANRAEMYVWHGYDEYGLSRFSSTYYRVYAYVGLFAEGLLDFPVRDSDVYAEEPVLYHLRERVYAAESEAFLYRGVYEIYYCIAYQKEYEYCCV